MVAIVAVFVAKFMSPVLVIVAVLTGFVSRSWLQVMIGVLFAAALHEIALMTMQETRSFNLMVFAIGIVAAAVWAGVIFAIRRGRRKAELS